MPPGIGREKPPKLPGVRKLDELTDPSLIPELTDPEGEQNFSNFSRQVVGVQPLKPQ